MTQASSATSARMAGARRTPSLSLTPSIPLPNHIPVSDPRSCDYPETLSTSGNYVQCQASTGTRPFYTACSSNTLLAASGTANPCDVNTALTCNTGIVLATAGASSGAAYIACWQKDIGASPFTFVQDIGTATPVAASATGSAAASGSLPTSGAASASGSGSSSGGAASSSRSSAATSASASAARASGSSASSSASATSSASAAAGRKAGLTGGLFGALALMLQALF